MRLGILSCEFFDYGLGGVGGFGWAARAVGRLFAERPELGVQPVYLSGRGMPPPDGGLDGIPFVVRGAGPRRYARALRAANPDLLLAIDYEPGFWPVLARFPRTPLLVWSRDPRGPREWAALDELRLPGRADRPAGLDRIGSASMRWVVALARALGRPLAFGSPAPLLASLRAPGAYRLPLGPIPLLPNPIVAPQTVAKAPEPTVAFLARLDPYKRPWLAVELGRRMPDVRFLLAGRSHFQGPGAWAPRDLPPNVELLGHVDETAKCELLGKAWVLLNTSRHEGLPVSFLEALAARTPIVASVDPEAVVSRFGALVAPADGDGRAALGGYESALRALLGDAPRRRALGTAGRDWVRATHTPDRFVGTLRTQAAALGVG